MVEIIALASFGAAAAAGFMWYRAWRMKKDIYTFTDKLEHCLNDMTAGKDIGNFSEPNETLWNKVYEKLLKLNQVWQKKNNENAEEKQQIKELISDISHQTKTPIANMKIYLEILQEENADPGKTDEFIKKLEGQTEKLDFLLHSMVKMSRLETGIIEIRKQTGDIYGTLAQAVAAVVPKAEKKHIGIHVDCDEEICVNHDGKWTEEAVFNLLDNAVKYTENGGSIKIAVSAQEIYTKISICDTGKGITRERQAEIFKRFYREPEVHDQEGIGVGLYLARKIITLQKGYIEVHSEEGKGADFQIYLPNE